jgi:hypothetical protein
MTDGNYLSISDLTCRVPTSATTRAGVPTGAPLIYDAYGRMVGWQATPNSTTNYASFLYDGEGRREEQVTGASTTVYVGSLEAVTNSGGMTTTTTYYYGAGHLLAEAVNGAFGFLATTAQGIVAVALNSGGTTTAAQLFAPYGTSRYSFGTMPTDYGYTSQRADVAPTFQRLSATARAVVHWGRLRGVTGRATGAGPAAALPWASQLVEGS